MFWLEEYHMFPNAGGWMDQDWYLLEDLKTHKRIHQRLEWEQRESQSTDEEQGLKLRGHYDDDVYEEQVDGLRYHG